MTARYGGKAVPTVGGVLLFGRVRGTGFPDAYLQAGRFVGTDRTRIVDSAEFRAPLPGLVEEAVAFLRKHEAVGLEVGALHHRERWPVPLRKHKFSEEVCETTFHCPALRRWNPSGLRGAHILSQRLFTAKVAR